MDMECRPGGAYPAQQVFIPGQRHIGMVPPLQQYLRTAKGQCFLNFFCQFLPADKICLGMPRRAEKGAEATGAHTDIGIIDIAVANVGNRHLGVQAHAHRMGEFRQGVQAGLAVQGFGRAAVKAAAFPDGIRRLKHFRIFGTVLVKRTVGVEWGRHLLASAFLRIRQGNKRRVAAHRHKAGTANEMLQFGDGHALG